MVTSASDDASALAASKPPNPPPAITILGRRAAIADAGFDDSGRSLVVMMSYMFLWTGWLRSGLPGDPVPSSLKELLATNGPKTATRSGINPAMIPPRKRHV